MSKKASYTLLHVLMIVFSFSSVFSKLAGQQETFSFLFIVFYGLVLLVLGIYAILWQQIIKTVPLSTAYANKAITVVWGMVWGFVIFGEKITRQKLIGAAVIILGVLIYNFPSKKDVGVENE